MSAGEEFESPATSVAGILDVTRRATSVPLMSAGTSATTELWGVGGTVTRTAVGQWTAAFNSPHPNGNEYHVSLTAEEQGNLRDTPDITVVQDSKTATGFDYQITTGDNGTAADPYIDTPHTLTVEERLEIVTDVAFTAEVTEAVGEAGATGANLVAALAALDPITINTRTDNLPLPPNGIGYRVTAGIGGQDITGIEAPASGEGAIILYVPDNDELDIVNDSIFSLAPNRVWTPNRAQFDVREYTFYTLIYDQALDNGIGKWIITNSSID